MCRSDRTSSTRTVVEGRPTPTGMSRSGVATGRPPYGVADRTVRASNQDREAAIALLNDHTTAGRLTLPEFEERVSAAYGAQLVSDLDSLLSDLPVLHAQAPRPVPQPGVAWANWAPWVLAGVICVVIWGLTSLGAGRVLYPWPMWVVGPWGLVLLSRTMSGRYRPLPR